MIIHYTFLLLIIILLSLLFRWAFAELPEERWQILGVIPVSKKKDGNWNGLNLTYYGFFIASAYLFGTTLVYILLGSLSVSAATSTAVLIGVCSLSVPAAKFLARIVENKPHTASVGAASFIGIILAPWIIAGVKTIPGPWTNASVQVLPTLTALIIAYAFGEGIGRLACISFGCCYGRPMNELPTILQRVVGFSPLVFSGATKKIAYAGHMEQVKTFPVQAVTAVLYCATGIFAIHLFLSGYFLFGFMLTLCITQVWRFLSEFLRADHRGSLKISIYQIMALLTIPYGLVIALLFPSMSLATADLAAGFTTLYNPMLILFLQFLWCAMFWNSGRSHVTGAKLQFHVNYDKI